MPRIHAERAARRLFGFLPCRQRRADFASRRKQFGGLAADHRDIFVFRRRGVLGDRKLHDLAFGDHRSGRRQDFQRLQAADFDHHLERLAEQEIADQDARFIAPQHACGGAAAPQFALVHDIVMQQRCGVHEFDRGGELDMAFAAIAGELRQRQSEHRPQPFAAGTDEVVGHLRDHRHLGPGARDDRGIDAFHVGGNELDQRLDRGLTRTFERDDNCHLVFLHRKTTKHRNAMVTRQVRRQI